MLHGQIVGTFTDSRGTRSMAFCWTGAGFTTIDPPGCHRHRGRGNQCSRTDRGRILQTPAAQAWFSPGRGHFHDDRSCRAPRPALAVTINNRRPDRGFLRTMSAAQHGFLLDKGGIHHDRCPGRHGAPTAFGINARGQIVGQIRKISATRSMAICWKREPSPRSTSRAATFTAAFGINERGQISGFYVHAQRDQYGSPGQGRLHYDRRLGAHPNQCPRDQRSRPDAGFFTDTGGTVHGFVAH